MRLTIRGSPEGLRSALSFAFSAVLHGAALGWIAMGAAFLTGGKPASLYDQEIKPLESHIVWYGVRGRLPDMRPAARTARRQPLRAARVFKQQIVSRAREDARPAQTILAPAPEIRLPKALPLPNILAVAAVPRPLRAFVPPPPRLVVRTAVLPEAPPVMGAAPLEDLALIAARTKAPPLPFRPPPEAKRMARAPEVLPAAPAVSADAPEFKLPRIPRGFTPPEAKQAPAPAPAADLATDAPPVNPAPPAVEPSLAIVGLHPVELPRIPTPPGSHEAGFSAGAKPRPTGSDSDSKNATLTVPGLLTRGGTEAAQAALMASLASPTSAASLTEGMRRMRDEAQARAAPAVHPPELSSPPDPRLAGRPVYLMAIQMPNITSDSGSWLVWFAERDMAERAAFEVRAPVPLHKVDPKYIVSAREERVQGLVKLYAIIRKNGQVDSVELLRRLDPRLDRSAEEALLKWQFQPATRDGVPVDVEAVFEIPFRLKPRESRDVPRQSLIVDADDTLWENNIFFERAFEEFVAFLDHASLSPREVRDVLDAIEVTNAKIHGYGTLNFGRNLKQTYEQLAEREISAADIRTVMGFAERILDCPMVVIDGVAATLDYLAARHDLTLFTKGHPEEQKLKIDRSGLAPYFAHAAIVKEKDAAAYRQLVAERAMDPERTWMIGNSPKSDVNAALEAGLNAVFVPHAHTWVLEHQEIREGPGNLLVLDKFEDLRKHF